MNFIKSFWKTITWALVVLILSTLSGQKVDELPFSHVPHFDKLVHFTMYFIFTFLLLLDLSKYLGKTISWKQIIIFSALGAIAYGGIMELLQEIPKLRRSTDIKDFIANSTGAISAVFLYKYTSAIYNRVYNKIMSFIIKRPNQYSL
jgi:VanZ family protein